MNHNLVLLVAYVCPRCFKYIDRPCAEKSRLPDILTTGLKTKLEPCRFRRPCCQMVKGLHSSVPTTDNFTSTFHTSISLRLITMANKTTIPQEGTSSTTQEEVVPLLSTPVDEVVQDPDTLRKKALNEVQEATDAYNQTWSLSKLDGAAEEVLKKMRNVVDTHADPKVKKEWNDKIIEFAHKRKADKDVMSSDTMKGLGLLLAAPVAAVGAVIFVAGGILKGVGSACKELGGEPPLVREGWFVKWRSAGGLNGRRTRTTGQSHLIDIFIQTPGSQLVIG